MIGHGGCERAAGCEDGGLGVAVVLRLPALLLLCHLLPVFVQAEGIRMNDQDAAATARGNAFTATADNPSAIYYNPAGITQLRRPQFRVGTYGLTYRVEHQSPSGVESDSKRGYAVSPNVYLTYPLADYPLSVGLGIYTPFGLSMKWPETTGFRSVALDGNIQYLTVQPVVAWQAVKTLSIGIGPTFNYARTDLKQGLSPFAGNDWFRFKGDAFAAGFSLGVRWQPVEKHAFGFTYRSATTVDYSGHTDTVSIASGLALRQDAKAKFECPQQVTLGWSYRPTPDWNLEVDANWTDWSSFSSVPIRQAIAVSPLTLNWRSSWYFAGGVTRKFGDGWHASAGYIFSQNSVPDAHFTPLVPDTDRHAFSIGLGRETAKWTWDVAYQLTRGTERTVSGSAVTSAGQSADGRYDWWSNALSVSVGRKF